ncbi:MAG: glycosyltransferase family 2 protein [Maioricimonas sp. JB049]
MPDLSIGLLTYKSPDLLDNVLTSIAETRGDLDAEVIVIDNASNDRTVDMVHERFPWVKLVCNDLNRGVAVGRNQILREATGRYIIFLDCDTKVLPGALQTLVETMDARPEISCCGPKLLYGDGTLQLSCRPFPAPLNIAIEGTFLRDWFPNSGYVKNYTLEDWDHNDIREVDWMYGAAMMFRREVFDVVGDFDEGFFYQYEDIDIFFRAAQHGLKTIYIPQAEIIHYYERERKALFHNKIHIHIRSILRYLRKDYYGRFWRSRRVGGRHAVDSNDQSRVPQTRS